MMIHFVYTAKGLLHPDREGMLQKALLSSDEVTARRLNTTWGEAQALTKKIGWQGHTRSGPFVISSGLMWDDGDKIWVVTSAPWTALEMGQTAWPMLSRTELIS
jgi:hypothetical protein